MWLKGVRYPDLLGSPRKGLAHSPTDRPNRPWRTWPKLSHHHWQVDAQGTYPARHVICQPFSCVFEILHFEKSCTTNLTRHRSESLLQLQVACSSENCSRTQVCASCNTASVCLLTSDLTAVEQLMESQASGDVPQRRKLNLKPRDESAASKAETEKKSSRSVRSEQQH